MNYLTRDTVGPLAAALIAGLIRQIQANPPGKGVLFAIDEMPTAGLPNLPGYLPLAPSAGKPTVDLTLRGQSGEPKMCGLIGKGYGRDRGRGLSHHRQRDDKGSESYLDALRAFVAYRCAETRNHLMNQ